MGSKSLTRIRADMRTDLKDSGSLWSDAELDRAVEKAFGDLGRFRPIEEVYEKTLDFDVSSESWTSPKDSSTTAIVNAQAINVADGSVLTIAAQPDVPRKLTLTITDADSSITGAIFIVTGLDENRQAIAETFYYQTGCSKTLTGKEIFKEVYSVEVDVIEGDGAGDVLSVGYGAYTDTWIWLANNPIQYNSETVTNAAGTTEYTRGTDYLMDYRNGRIKAISGGSLAAETAYKVSSYKISQIDIDLSTLPRFVRVNRVEYPTGDVPQSFLSHEVWGDILTVTSGDQENQSNMAETYHIAIHYLKSYSPPTVYAPSDCPDFLEETVLMAAEAYALLEYALKQEHQAATDLASARTAEGSCVALHTLLQAALTSAKKYLDNNSAADAAGILQDITDNVADLRTAIETAVDAMASAQTAVGIAVDASNTADDAAETATGIAAITTYQTAIVTALDAAKTALGYVETLSLDKASVGAEAYLDTGDGDINTLTIGGEQQVVPETYVAYSMARVNIANTRVSEAIGFIQEAQQRAAGIDAYIVQANAHVNAANGFSTEANARILQIQSYAQEATVRLDNLRTYLEQAAQYVNVASRFIDQANAYASEIYEYHQESIQYQEAATREIALAEQFRTEATNRRDEVWSIWRDKAQFIGEGSVTSRYQNS